MKWCQRLFAWILLIVSIISGFAKAEEGLDEQDAAVYEILVEFIDQGDYIGFVQMLLEDQVSDDLYSYIMRKDGEIVDLVVIDAVRTFVENGRIQMVAALRTLGYFDDARFELYWKKNGIEEIPLQSVCDDMPGVDLYLLSEISRAYQYRRDIMNSVQEIYNSEMLSAEMYDALYELFGFDYMNSASWEEYNAEVAMILTNEDMVQYDDIMRHIDDGDVMYFANLMSYGEISDALFSKLMGEEKELIQLVVSQMLSVYANEGKTFEIIFLRANGYATDEIMQYYWRTIGVAEPDYWLYEVTYPDVDLYMLHELINVYNSEDNGVRLLNELWDTGIIDDGVQKALIDILGFDYTIKK